MSKTLSAARASLSLVYITLNLLFWILPLMILALLKLVIPLPALRGLIYKAMILMYSVAVWIDHFLLVVLLGINLEVSGLEDIEHNKNYLVVSNHQSWADILILQSLLNKRAALIKFIVKQELIYLPLVGLICWAYEYPFVKRQSMKSTDPRQTDRKSDLGTINKRFRDLGRKGHTTAIVNFVEGTRFNPLKSKRVASPYRHLMKPRAGGLTHILQTFGSQFDYLLDITLVYHTQPPVFWSLLGGSCKSVRIEIRKVPMKDLLKTISKSDSTPDYHQVSEWLKTFWEEKDQKIDQIRKAAHLKNWA